MHNITTPTAVFHCKGKKIVTGAEASRIYAEEVEAGHRDYWSIVNRINNLPQEYCY